MKRRSFIDIFLFLSLTGTIASFLYPLIRYLIPPKKAKVTAKKVVVGKAREIPPNTHKIFKFGEEPAILIKTQEGELLAFSAVCTHLSCSVIYQSEEGIILCPCHNGKFDLSGRVISGPPPSPLRSYKVEISGEEIIVSRT